MIKGKATIQLFDEKSGEVVKELHPCRINTFLDMSAVRMAYL